VGPLAKLNEIEPPYVNSYVSGRQRAKPPELFITFHFFKLVRNMSLLALRSGTGQDQPLRAFSQAEKDNKPGCCCLSVLIFASKPCTPIH